MAKEQSYNERMEAKGYVKTCQWVPKEYREEHIKHAEKLRRRRNKLGQINAFGINSLHSCKIE